MPQRYYSRAISRRDEAVWLQVSIARSVVHSVRAMSRVPSSWRSQPAMHGFSTGKDIGGSRLFQGAREYRSLCANPPRECSAKTHAAGV